MLSLTIPGRGEVNLSNIILDLNGTLTVDGQIAANTVSLLNRVSEQLQVYVLTADTLGSAAKLKEELQADIRLFAGENISAAKAVFLEQLGAESTMAVGNGDNDAAMLKKAAIGIVVLGPEGCSIKALQNADLLVKDIDDALMLVLRTQRLIADLRD
ncbi:MAG: ATPase P [Firmicutes bacterium]|nr:ATPase P [Bacillota bacterium]